MASADTTHPGKSGRILAGPAGVRRDVLFSFLDQGFNSLHSLVLAGALIATAEPATYGLFAFILTVVLVSASLQYGAIGIPLLVHLRRMDEGQRAAGMETLRAADFWLRLAAAAATAIGALVVTGDWSVAAAAAAFCMLYLSRETTRNGLYTSGRAGAAALLAALALGLFLPLYAAALALLPPLLAPFLASAAATAAALAVLGHVRPRLPASPGKAWRGYHAGFAGTGWTLASSAANEVQTRLHVFVVQFARGADQVGMLEAGRILIAPLFLVVSAWQRVGQPLVTSLVEAGDIGAARRTTLAGVALVSTTAAIWCGMVWLGWDLAERHLFAAYSGMGPYVAGWAGYAVLLLANWSLVVFLNAIGRFRTVAWVTFCAAATTAVLLLVMLLDVPLIAALAVLALVQAAVLCLFVALVMTARPAAGEAP